MYAKLRRLTRAALCCIGAVLWLFAGVLMNVSAATPQVTLTLVCRTDETILSGLHWNIYRVGSRIGPDFVLDGDFADYQVDLTDFSVEAMEAAAKTLESYADTDNISPLYDGKTNEEGLIKFDKLSPGLYLLTGDTLLIDNIMYIPSTLLIEVDNSGEDMNIDAYPKIIIRTESSQIKLFTLKKIWLDSNGQPYTTFEPITAEIYQNNVLYDTVTLSVDNDRTFTWYGDIDDEWRVKELNVPENCTVVYDFNETQYAIVNTINEEVETTTSPTEPTTETLVTDTIVTDTTTNTSENLTTTDSSSDNATQPSNVSTTKITQENLPQTGQTWWPVPVLGLAGAVFIALGLRVCAEEKNEKN